MNFCSIAVEYGLRNVAVFPLLERGKTPLTKHGFKDASKDADTIRTMWQGAETTANIGIATGAASNVFVLDIDGEEGEAALAALEEAHGALPETPEVQTGKGRHLYFAYPEGAEISNSASKIGDKLDIRGNGGYVVAPPSIHPSGRAYSWHATRRPSKMAWAQAPQWLIDLIVKKPRREQQQSVERPTLAPASDRRVRSYVTRAVEQECAELSSCREGGRNDRLNVAAVKLGGLIGQAGLTEEYVRASLTNAAMACGLEQEETRKTIDSGVSFGKANPRKIELDDRPRPQARSVRQEKEETDYDPETGEVFDHETKALEPRLVVSNDVVVRADWKQDILWKDETNQTPIAKSFHNAMLYLEHEYEMQGVLKYNEFIEEVFIARCPPWDNANSFKPRTIRDSDYANAVAWLEIHKIKISKREAQDAMTNIAIKDAHRFDPAKDWLKEQAKNYDGIPRLETWLIDMCGAEDNEQNRYMGRKWLLSAVYRIMEPGCKADNILVFEGEQGIGKSTALRTLGQFGDMNVYIDSMPDIGTKDSFLQMRGVVIIEIAELGALMKASATNSAIKAFLTSVEDKYRPPYGTNTISVKRRCIFAGTINPNSASSYLTDETGARRFWPVRVTNIDIDHLRDAAPMLWAEAYLAWEKKEKTWDITDQVLSKIKAEQRSRYDEDPWTPIIQKFLNECLDRGSRCISREDIISSLGMPQHQIDRRVGKRVTDIMTVLGWSYLKNYVNPTTKKSERRYYPPMPKVGEE